MSTYCWSWFMPQCIVAAGTKRSSPCFSPKWTLTLSSNFTRGERSRPHLLRVQHYRRRRRSFCRTALWDDHRIGCRKVVGRTVLHGFLSDVSLSLTMVVDYAVMPFVLKPEGMAQSCTRKQENGFWPHIRHQELPNKYVSTCIRHMIEKPLPGPSRPPLAPWLRHRQADFLESGRRQRRLLSLAAATGVLDW